MPARAGLLGGTLRLAALAVGGVAIATLLQRATVQPPSASLTPPGRTATNEALAGVALGEHRGMWSLRMGGWYIRLDGVAGDRASAPIAPSTALVPALPVTPVAAISAFDPLIVHQATAEGFDWRLIAAIISQESGFNPNSRSVSGAYGLMQVRPVAAEAVGAAHFTAPEDNIRTGVQYLRHLDETLRTAPGRDRLSLILAAYNMGPGHVRDAQEVARRLGYDPTRWRGAMELILPLLEVPAIYAELPNGFAKGRATVAYVQRILDQYQRFARKTGGAPGAEAVALAHD